MDSKPRKMTEEDYRVLNSCAEMVCSQPSCLASCMAIAVANWAPELIAYHTLYTRQ